MRARTRELLVSGCALLGLLTVFGIGCVEQPVSGELPEALAVVVTELPAGASPEALNSDPAPDSRYPEGSRIALIVEGQPGTGRILSGGFVAAGAPDVSSSGDAVLFTARRSAADPWTIYRSDLQRRSRPQAITQLDTDCTDPAFLAGGRAVFSCLAPVPGREQEGDKTWALHTARLDGSHFERITYGLLAASGPTQLPDGRVLFSMWQEAGAGRSQSSTALFTVNADGTLLQSFSGHHGGPVLKQRPRLADQGRVVFLGAEPPAYEPLLLGVEMARPQSPMESYDPPVTPLSAEPLGGGEMLLVGRDERVGAPGSSGLYRWRPGDSPIAIRGHEKWDVVEAVPRRPAPEPKDRPSAVVRTRLTGILLCYDAQRSDGVVGPSDSSSPARRVVLETLNGGARSSAMVLGVDNLDDDGSFHLEVPADRPLRVRTLDEAGAEVATSGWFWLRPGEVRSCFGCHESREVAPVNRPIAALAHGPSRLGVLGEAGSR
ncbi:MAG: hypothetical protein ACE5GX_00325 [Thermoanaerobaculia bacterium]